MIKHRGNFVKYLRSRLQSEIKEGAKLEIKKKNWLTRLALRGISGSEERFAVAVASSTTKNIIWFVFFRLALVFVLYSFYTISFRWMALPLFIENEIHLNLLQTGLYPFALVSDYFFQTGFVAALIAK